MSMYSRAAIPRVARKSRTNSISARLESRLTVGKLTRRSRISALFMSSAGGRRSLLLERVGNGNANSPRRRDDGLGAIAENGRVGYGRDAEGVGQVADE